MAGRILLGIILSADCSGGEVHADPMTCVRKGKEPWTTRATAAAIGRQPRGIVL